MSAFGKDMLNGVDEALTAFENGKIERTEYMIVLIQVIAQTTIVIAERLDRLADRLDENK